MTSLLLMALGYLQFIPRFTLFIPLLAGLAIIALGAFNIQWNFFLPAIHQGHPQQQAIALTFDDGPHPVYTPLVAELLHRYNIKATFFCIGKHAAVHPHLVKALHDQGHLIANHSFTHTATIDFHSRNQWLEEIRKTDAAIETVTGEKPRHFRPPFGVTTPHLAKAIRKTNHTVIGWRVRPYDTVTSSAQRIAERILRKTKPGHIILLHDTHERVVPVLERLLPLLLQRNYTFVTIEQLIQHSVHDKK